MNSTLLAVTLLPVLFSSHPGATPAAILGGLPAPVRAEAPVASICTDDEVSETEDVAREYLRLITTERDLPASCAMFTEDALFTDPTAEAFAPALAKGIRGRKAIQALMASWGIQEMSFDIKTCFFTGETAFFAGLLGWKSAGTPAAKDVPFATRLTVRDGMIVDRCDYGDYRLIVPTIVPVSAATFKVTQAYMAAFTSFDFESQSSLMDEAVTLLDYTGPRGGAADPIEGRKAALAYMSRNASTVKDCSFDEQLSFSMGRYAFYSGHAEYHMSGKALGVPQEWLGFEHNVMVVLEVRDGKILSQVDYSDADAFRRQLKAHRKAK